MVREALARWGKIDILVNNAGMNRPAYLPDVKVEDFDAIFSLNVRAAFFAALLNNWPMGFYHPSTLVRDAMKRGIRGSDSMIRSITSASPGTSSWNCSATSRSGSGWSPRCGGSIPRR